MGTEQELTNERIGKIAEASKLVENNTHLDGVVSFRIGRLSDYTESAVSRMKKKHEQIRKNIYDQQIALQKQQNEKKALVIVDEELAKKRDEEVSEITLKIDSFNMQFTEEITRLFEDGEMVKIPDFKMSDFIAKTEKKVFENHGTPAEPKMVEVIIPPTIGAAMGFITSEPMPLPQRIGIRLASTAATVISLGLSRCTAPSIAAL